jgi:hypothetical protein
MGISCNVWSLIECWCDSDETESDLYFTCNKREKIYFSFTLLDRKESLEVEVVCKVGLKVELVIFKSVLAVIFSTNQETIRVLK